MGPRGQASAVHPCMLSSLMAFKETNRALEICGYKYKATPTYIRKWTLQGTNHPKSSGVFSFFGTPTNLNGSPTAIRQVNGGSHPMAILLGTIFRVEHLQVIHFCCFKSLKLRCQMQWPGWTSSQAAPPSQGRTIISAATRCCRSFTHNILNGGGTWPVINWKYLCWQESCAQVFSAPRIKTSYIIVYIYIHT